MIAFTVPGQPMGKGRPRLGAGRMYTPAKTVSYEGLVAYHAHVEMNGRPLLEGACAVTLDIVCPVPASWSQKKQAAALAGRIHQTTRPDIDNVEKAIFDACNNVVWKDDVQVVRVTKAKRYGSTPGVSVTVVAAESGWTEAQQTGLVLSEKMANRIAAS